MLLESTPTLTCIRFQSCHIFDELADEMQKCMDTLESALVQTSFSKCRFSNSIKVKRFVHNLLSMSRCFSQRLCLGRALDWNAKAIRENFVAKRERFPLFGIAPGEDDNGDNGDNAIVHSHIQEKHSSPT